MKTLSAFLFLFLTFTSTAQIGVVVIDEQDSSPVGQWFSLRGEENESTICFYQDLVHLKEKLNAYLEDYGLRMEDAELTKEGDLLWAMDNGNGFYVNMVLAVDEEMGYLYVYTYPANEE